MGEQFVDYQGFPCYQIVHTTITEHAYNYDWKFWANFACMTIVVISLVCYFWVNHRRAKAERSMLANPEFKLGLEQIRESTAVELEKLWLHTFGRKS